MTRTRQRQSEKDRGEDLLQLHVHSVKSFAHFVVVAILAPPPKKEVNESAQSKKAVSKREREEQSDLSVFVEPEFENLIKAANFEDTGMVLQSTEPNSTDCVDETQIVEKACRKPVSENTNNALRKKRLLIQRTKKGQ